jgi:hypothetical protein
MPGGMRSQEVLDIFREVDPHLVLPDGNGGFKDVETFTWHPLRDRFEKSWGHLHSLGKPHAPTYYEVRPEMLEHIPEDKRQHYPISRIADEINGTILHSDWWDFKYEVKRADNQQPVKFQQTVELGSLPDTWAVINRTERECRLALSKEDETPLVRMSFRRPVGLKRTVVGNAPIDLPSGIRRDLPYPIYHPTLLPTNYLIPSNQGIEMRVITGNGGYNNFAVTMPTNIGIRGVLQVNVPGRVGTLRTSTGKWITVNGVWVWRLHDDPSQWFDVSDRKGTERWSNLNPLPGLGDLSWRFSYKALLQFMVASTYKGVLNLMEADEQLEADGFWFLTNLSGDELRETPDYDTRRQYMHPEAEFAFHAATHPDSTTSSSRFIVHELREDGNDDTYRPLFAGSQFDKPGVDRDREGYVLAPGV